MSPVEEPRSIQAEQQETYGAITWATDEEVDDFVANADDAVLICRERARHNFPTIKSGGLKFSGVTADGLMERRLLCPDCARVERVELWDVRHRRGAITRCELVAARLDYLDSTYLNKQGTGRIKAKQIRNSVGSSLLAGQSFRELRKEVMAISEMIASGGSKHERP
jgi:hypothetical protein